MEPTVVVGGALLLLMMLGGKKKGKTGPLAPGDKPTPLPPGNKQGPSDDLPPGSKGGHLPKGKGYSPPSDMKTTDIWVSPDCQAYLIGEDWYPTAEGMDAYIWYEAYYRNPLMDGDPETEDWIDHVLAVYMRVLSEASAEGHEFIVYDGQRYGADFWDFPGWMIGRFPDLYAVADGFTIAVMEEVSPLCAELIPRFGQFDAEKDWSTAWDAWATAYPAMADLMHDIREHATVGETPEGENVALPRKPGEKERTYVGARNLSNAWADSVGVF